MQTQMRSRLHFREKLNYEPNYQASYPGVDILQHPSNSKATEKKNEDRKSFWS